MADWKKVDARERKEQKNKEKQDLLARRKIMQYQEQEDSDRRKQEQRQKNEAAYVIAEGMRSETLWETFLHEDSVLTGPSSSLSGSSAPRSDLRGAPPVATKKGRPVKNTASAAISRLISLTTAKREWKRGTAMRSVTDARRKFPLDPLVWLQQLTSDLESHLKNVDSRARSPVAMLLDDWPDLIAEIWEAVSSIFHDTSSQARPTWLVTVSWLLETLLSCQSSGLGITVVLESIFSREPSLHHLLTDSTRLVELVKSHLHKTSAGLLLVDGNVRMRFYVTWLFHLCQRTIQCPLLDAFLWIEWIAPTALSGNLQNTDLLSTIPMRSSAPTGQVAWRPAVESLNSFVSRITCLKMQGRLNSARTEQLVYLLELAHCENSALCVLEHFSSELPEDMRRIFAAHFCSVLRTSPKFAKIWISSLTEATVASSSSMLNYLVFESEDYPVDVFFTLCGDLLRQVERISSNLSKSAKPKILPVLADLRKVVEAIRTSFSALVAARAQERRNRILFIVMAFLALVSLAFFLQLRFQLLFVQ